MSYIGFHTAQSLTDRSERTLWRLIGEGSIRREIENGKARIEINTLVPYFCLPIDANDFDTIVAADQGDPIGQTDLALLFLAKGKPKGAVPWLQLAARQECTEAMHWLGRCHVDGNGLPKNEKTGLRWLMKAAVYGHVISIQQMEAIRVLRPNSTSALQG